jgi:NAD(P)-dependent dehydrogenase (short-subunit alcohol dehydrogenase family)
MSQAKWDATQIPVQSGKLAIITGSSSGIGFEAARELARNKAAVIIAVRNAEKGANAVTAIKNEIPDATVSHRTLDLANLASVRKFTDTIRAEYAQIDLLINNAGVMVPPYGKTSDGFELQFGTNHLGHFALTLQLLDLVEAAPAGRVVNVSSGMHRAGKLNFDDLSWEKRTYRKWNAYGDSKLANLYFTYELARRLHGRNSPVIVAAAHPGYAATELQRHSPMTLKLNGLFAQSSAMGALPTLRAATDPEVRSADYFGPKGMFEMKGFPVRVESSKLSHNTATALRLWQISEELTATSLEGAAQ